MEKSECTWCGKKIPQKIAAISQCRFCQRNACKSHLQTPYVCKECYANLAPEHKDAIERLNKKRIGALVPVLVLFSASIFAILFISSFFGLILTLLGSLISSGAVKDLNKKQEQLVSNIRESQQSQQQQQIVQ